ncbi:MAG: PD-(D/E)XK nuclease family protein [Acidimicrobiales bacterium]
MRGVTGRWVPYGLPSAHALLEAIRHAKATEALAPVTVVVASNQVGVSVRRQLASGSLGPTSGAGPGLVGVTFATPYRLAELLGAAELAAQGRRPVSTPVLAAAVRSVLRVDAGVFAPVAAHPATEAALVASYRELRDLTDEALDALRRQSRRAGEVVRVQRATRAHLVGGWYDEEDLMEAATSVAASGATTAATGSVVVYLPQRLSRHAGALLVAVGAETGLTVVAGTTGVARADAEVAQSVDRLGLCATAPDQSVLASVVGPTTTRLVTASDADDEVRAAVRVVVDAARAGRSLDRIAVLHASQEPYGRLLHDHLEAAGVATNGAAEVPLAGRLASRSLLAFLALPTTDFRRQDVFTWLTGAPVLDGGRVVPAGAWERASRTAGVVGGPQDWDRQLRRAADQLDIQAANLDADAEEPQWRGDRARSDAESARSLRRYVLGLIDRLAAAQAAVPWSERVRWTKQLLVDLLGGPTRRDRWPLAERRAADRLELALDRLVALDEVDGPVGLDVFTRTLTVELESDLGRTGRFGEGVLVGPLSMAIGVDLDLVVMVGMAEGTFPVTVREDSLLPDDDREVARGELALRAGHVDRLHHHFLAVMSGAREQVLCVPKGDLRRSRDRVPSRWALDVASELAGRTMWSADLLAEPAHDWLSHVASFDAGLRTAVPATAQEHRLRRLLAASPTRSGLQEYAAGFDATLGHAVSAVDARLSTTLTRFDGNLEGLTVPSPVDLGSSATRLETWAACPHRYFMRHTLHIEALEQPEDALQITPIERGKLVHAALERFVVEALHSGHLPEPAEPWSAEDRRRLATITTELCARFEQDGLTGRAIFWHRDRRRILAEMDTFLTKDDDRRRGERCRPLAAELGFGSDGAPPVLFPLGDGRHLPLRGKADRIDQSDDGALWVIDYKTGKADSYKKLNADDPAQGGLRLQLAIYGLAARQHARRPDAPVRAEYWFTSKAGRFERIGYPVDDDVVAKVGDALGTIVSGIEAGLFPAHPQPHSTSPFTDCQYCDPDNLGTTELLRRWERKVQDPVMGTYLALVAPSDAQPEEEP